MHPVRTMKSYHQELREALDDSFLRETLDSFAIAYRANRAAIFADINEKALIAEVAEAKDACIGRLDELYLQFKVEAEKRGVTVHRAVTAEEAAALIQRIAAENGCKRIIKSKSMTGEEIHLNQALEDAGCEVTETDLGEWIIQLRGEKPTHMVMPAVHLSRYQVADLFSETTREAQESDPQKLVKVARRALRGKFAAADMGISGANFALADSGSIGLCTNEGNARLATTLPRVHVALCGLDKLFPSVVDALRVIKVLPRNATGQMITSYVTWITGATECSITPDKRKSMHVVFLDNGRSALAGDVACRETLRCVRCGACANVCPVYRLVGGHKMGHIYIGAIGLILTYFFHGKDNARALVQNCINCGACKEVCAAGIDLPGIIQELRSRINEENGSPVESALLGAVLANRKLFHTLLKYGKWAQLPVTGKTRFVRHLPSILMGGQNFRTLPALAPRSFREEWDEKENKAAGTGPRVALFAGCAQDFIYPEQLHAAVAVLRARGCTVVFPEKQTCCGLPAQMMGERKAAESVAQQNVGAFSESSCEYILTLCASCASHLKHAYPKLLSGTQKETAQVEDFTAKIIDFSTFAVDILQLDRKDMPLTAERVCYHASCHLGRALGVTEQPRKLLATAAQYEASEEEGTCCGFGGTYSLKFPEIAEKLLSGKLDRLEATGATTLVVDCPGCIMQLRGGEQTRGNALRVEHMAEFVARKLR